MSREEASEQPALSLSRADTSRDPATLGSRHAVEAWIDVPTA